MLAENAKEFVAGGAFIGAKRILQPAQNWPEWKEAHLEAHVDEKPVAEVSA